ncbi:hypothetical protein M440DRAFT_1392686 [Trichoderma longibrachiatum ATCC 18648]|uniref:Bromodomain-containing protein n=1 Tax=Trichoderma longibrachiatum ATCC 18648 TaxID=983965 RepID=A0A2T4C168_TRILO|nr:hypothetical protein M440DRAFT_1392686 [Trichoderma longibrachiatum ATCC 18648]
MASPTADQPPLADKDKMAEVNGCCLRASSHAPPVSESADSAKPEAEKENKASSDKPDEALVNGKPSPAASADTPNGVSTTNGQGEKDKDQDKGKDQENDKEKAQEAEKKNTPTADAPVAAKSESVQEKPVDSAKDNEKPVDSAKDEEKKPMDSAKDEEKKSAEEEVAQKKGEAETTAQEKPDVEMRDAESADDAKPPADTAAAPTLAKEPKRTVRAPKPKDIDYTTKPSRKKLKPEMQFCDEVLAELMHPKNSTLNTWFLDAVDAEGLNIPDYYSIIKKPMDLGKVSRMVNSGEITNAKEFDKNVRLIFANCYQFNGPPDQGNPVSNLAKQLENLYVQHMKGKDAWLAKYAKANAPAASASNASDEDDDDESDDDEHAAPAVDNSKELQELKAKLEEESSKLNSMFASGTPQALIDCQRVIVDTVQQALYKVAQKQTEAKPKHQDKAAKKSSKPSKSKTAGSAPSRKSSTHAPPPKKSSSAKKPPPKRTLSAADKDQIASAINDLEYPHLDRAIDIIKRDTGQNENNEGELELDIDQLSSDALNKLWDLCRKVLPGFGKDSNATTKSPEVNRAVPAKQAPKSASKPKKNKPMSAQEQEARIAQLTAIQQLYKPGQEPADDASHAPAHNRHDESSDDSDSEEE